MKLDFGFTIDKGTLDMINDKRNGQKYSDEVTVIEVKGSEEKMILYQIHLSENMKTEK